MTGIGEWAALYECRPAKPRKPPKTRTVTAESGLRERMAKCPLCGTEVLYVDLFGFGVHKKPGAPSYPEWAAKVG